MSKPRSTEMNIVRQNLFTAACRSFHDAMMAWNINYVSVRNKVTEERKRRLRTIPQSLSEEQITRIVESGKDDVVLSQVFSMDVIELEDITANVEERHAEIVNLEKQVAELVGLFRDLALMVDGAEEKVQHISHHIAVASDNVAHAETKLQKAEQRQRSGRKCWCYCVCALVLLLAIVVIIMGVVNKFNSV